MAVSRDLLSTDVGELFMLAWRTVLLPLAVCLRFGVQSQPDAFASPFRILPHLYDVFFCLFRQVFVVITFFFLFFFFGQCDSLVRIFPQCLFFLDVLFLSLFSFPVFNNFSYECSLFLSTHTLISSPSSLPLPLLSSHPHLPLPCHHQSSPPFPLRTSCCMINGAPRPSLLEARPTPTSNVNTAIYYSA